MTPSKPFYSLLLFLLLLILLLFLLLHVTSTSAAGGRWELLQRSTGVSAMHMQLLNNDRVIIFDRTDTGRSNLSLPNDKCRHDANDTALKVDCTAHSLEYDVASNAFRPLMVLTDTWCSSGTVAPDGRLVQTGGFNDGDRTARTLQPCTDGSCDWEETPNALAVRRWYSTNQILPDGRAFVIGGRRQFNYEFYPNSGSSAGSIDMPFLRQTLDREENNLYPFVHLNVDGHLFIFSNNRAILFDYTKNAVVRTYPAIPGGDPRNYPSSGSSVLLPLMPSGTEAEVLVCGGAPTGSFLKANSTKTFVTALTTCGRLKITDPSPAWSMETMPAARVMGDMVLLPTGTDVLIINGAGAGSAGWEDAGEPVLAPIIYRTNAQSGSRFTTQNPTTTPRMYHSTAVLLRDGRVLVGGSNPHVYYNFTAEFPTDLSLEAFSPDYLSSRYAKFRPRIASPASPLKLGYGKQFSLRFTAAAMSSRGSVAVTMVAPAFATHSFSMNQRLLVLQAEKAAAVAAEGPTYDVAVTAPASGVLAPAGYYVVFVVNAGVPSEGAWAHIG